MTKKYETIIIGGGVSGLACLRRLCQESKNTLLITKEIGGRIRTSHNHIVNFGAVYMFDFYKAVMSFVAKKRKLPVRTYTFFDGKGYSNYLGWRHVSILPQLLKMWWILRKFTRRISRLLQDAGNTSIKQLIENDPYLHSLWKTPALSFIASNGIEKFHRVYGDPICGITLYCKSENLNAFTYLGVFFPLASTAWEMDLSDTLGMLTKGLEEHILLDEVVRVTGNDKIGFSIETKEQIFSAKNVVFAAPLPHLKNVDSSLPQPYSYSAVYVLNVVGTLQKIFTGKEVVIFDQKAHDIYILWKQIDDSYTVYSKRADPPLGKYFEEYRVRFQHYWDYAVTIQGKDLIDQQVSSHKYIASDCNFSMLESSFLSGEFAANCIIVGEKISSTSAPSSVPH